MNDSMNPHEEPVLFMNEVLADIPENGLVLDVGCAGGSFDFSTTKSTVVGVDIDFPKTERFKQHRERGNVHFIKADARFLPFRDGSFDALLYNWTLEHFPHVALCIEEADRVARPEGRLYASIPDGHSFDDRLYRFLFRGGGHLNQYSFESFIKEVYDRTRFKLVSFSDWCTGLTYLNFEESSGSSLNRLAKYVIMKFGLQRILLRVLRMRDPYFHKPLSRTGWIFLFRKDERCGLRRPWGHICRKCGSAFDTTMNTDRIRPQKSIICDRMYECPICGTGNDYYGADDHAGDHLFDHWCTAGNVRKRSYGGREFLLLEPRQQNAIIDFPIRVVSGTFEVEIEFTRPPAAPETYILGFNDHAWGDVASFFIEQGRVQTIVKSGDDKTWEMLDTVDLSKRNRFQIVRVDDRCLFFVNGARVSDVKDPCPKKPLFVGIIAEKGEGWNSVKVTNLSWSQ